MMTTTLLELACVGLVVAQAVILGRQDAIELFYQGEKFTPVFFDRDKGAQVLNAIAITFVHGRNRQQLNHLSRDSVCSMSNNRGRTRLTENRKAIKNATTDAPAAYGPESSAS